MKNLILVLLMTAMFYSLALSQSSAEITLSIGEGTAPPGATNGMISVSLENQSNQVKGVQVDICDVDDFLACTSCDTTERTASLDCSSNELENGCCRIILFSLSGGCIEEGTGPVFALNYNVSGGAPSGECRELNPESIKISDETGTPLTGDVVTESGQFCFSTSSSTTTNGNSGCLLEEIYGEHSEETELLRYFRDNALSKTPAGQELIRLYYQWSPLIVKAIEEDEEFKVEMKETIDAILPVTEEEGE